MTCIAPISPVVAIGASSICHNKRGSQMMIMTTTPKGTIRRALSFTSAARSSETNTLQLPSTTVSNGHTPRGRRSSRLSFHLNSGTALTSPTAAVAAADPTIASTTTSTTAPTNGRPSLRKMNKYTPAYVPPIFLINICLVQLISFCTIGVLTQMATSVVWYVVPTSVYVCEFFGWLTHVLGHRKYMGAWYRAHMGHHLQDYPAWRFLSTTYINASVNNSPGYVPTVLLTPIVVCAICRVVMTMDVWMVCQVVAILSLYVSNEFHQAYHVRGHYLERWAWFHKLRALHYYHHKGNMQHNFALSDFVLDRVHGSLIRSPTDFVRRRRINSFHKAAATAFAFT